MDPFLQPGGGQEFSPPKIAEPTQSRWLQRSEGQFWRGRYLLCTFRRFNALSAVCRGRGHHSGRTKKQCTRPQQNICPRHPNKCWSHLSTSHSGRHTEAQWSRSLSLLQITAAEVYQSLRGFYCLPYLFYCCSHPKLQHIIKRRGEECCKPCTTQTGKKQMNCL